MVDTTEEMVDSTDHEDEMICRGWGRESYDWAS